MTPPKPILAPMLASIGEAAMPIHSLPTSRSTTVFARSSRCSPTSLPGSGRGWATRRHASSPRSRRRSSNGHVRRQTNAILDGEIVALDGGGRPAGFQRLQGRIHIGGFGKHRAHARKPDAPLAPPRSSLSICCTTTERTWRSRTLRERRGALEELFTPATRVPGTPLERDRVRRRPGALRARQRTRVGRPDREAGRFAIRERQEDVRLAENEDRPRTGVRRWRMDRPAERPHRAGSSSPRRLRRENARLHRPRRHRVRRARARSG